MNSFGRLDVVDIVFCVLCSLRRKISRINHMVDALFAYTAV